MKRIMILALALLGALGASAQTSYFTPILSGQNSGGETLITNGVSNPVNFQGVNYICRVTPLPPVLTLFGSTATGTVSGLTGTVTQLSTTLQPDVVYSGSATSKFVYSGGPANVCGHAPGFVLVQESPHIQMEVAISFLLKVSAAGPNLWNVTPDCSDVPVYNWPIIDFWPAHVRSDGVGVNAWVDFGGCVRNCTNLSGARVKWVCAPLGVSLPADSSGGGGHCTFNPYCP